MKVFVVDMLGLKGKVDELRENLSRAEVGFAEGIRNSNVREQFIISKAMVRKFLAETEPLKGVRPADIEIESGPNGKPYVAGKAVHYNVSHSKNLLVVAIDDAAVGVDVEYMKERDFDALTKYYFSDKRDVAGHILQSADKKTEFYKQWTLAEAEAKLAGVGVFGWKQKSGQLSAKYSHSRIVNDNYMLTVASNDKINQE